jgi:type II secretory pathway pseudopilin PulG
MKIKRINMKKNIIGMTLIETLIAITLGISVAVGLYLFMNRLNEKLVDSDTANVFIKIAGAMDNRFAVDGYAASNFNKNDWSNNTEANKFLNSFNGKSGSCATPDGWVPNVKDPVLKNKQMKSKNIPCNIFKDRTPLDAKMSAKLIINAINNQVLTSYVSFYYDTNERMLDAYPRWKNIINEAYNKDTLNNSSKHIYSFMDKSKNTFINDKECLIAKRNCALVIGIVSDEASSLIHLSTIGDNKQVGKLSFSRGLLNPQVCQKWTNASGSWVMEKTICGIENDNEKIGFKLGNINSGLISMDKVCEFKNVSSDGYLNIKDENGNVLPVNTLNIPCGINTQNSGASFVVTAIVDDVKAKELFTENLASFKFNTDKLNVYTITVNEKTNSYDRTNVTNEVILPNHLFATDLDSELLDGESLRAKSNFQIGAQILTTNSIDETLVDITNTMTSANLRTFNISANDIQTNKFKSNGAFNIGGNIIANTFTETGVLSADKIDLASAFFVTGSGAIGGYAEIGGVSNPERVGISARDAAFKTNFFTRMSDYIEKYSIQVLNVGAPAEVNKLTYSDIAFGVNGQGGIYLKESLEIPYVGGFGSSYYKVDKTGDLTAVVNYYESSGCCTDAPQQFYGAVGISGSFTINSQPRYVDVEDLNGGESGFVVDPQFITPNPKYSLSDYKRNSLVFNNLRLSNYATKIGTFEASYNTFNNAIHTPGLKGPSGDTGGTGLPGDQGKKGKQGVQGSQGFTGPIYNEKSLIWLPKEVTCGKQDSDMTTKYGSTNNKGAWTYNDVIEGLCTTGKGSIKYFKRLTPLGNSCSASQFEYDVYECKEAKYRIEPYAFNIKPIGNFCLGDDLANKQLDEGDPSKGIIDKDNNTICYTDTNIKHTSANRAYKYGFLYYANGNSDDLLGSRNTETSVMSTVGKNNWKKVDTCGAASSRTPEDILGLSSADFIEDGGSTSPFSNLADEDVGSSCKKQGALSYRKVNYNGLTYGNPTQFNAYRANKFTEIDKYMKKNAASCNREQVYEINSCEAGITDLTKINYTTHPIGFIMPKAEDADNGNGGLTGKYVWLKGDQVCLTGTAQASYPGSTDWYPSDRIDTPCSVDNSYRSEYLGACGANSNRSSYQMYVCKDEFYRPAQPDLAYRLTDIKCLNSTGQAVDKDQKPLPTEQIKDYYPNIKKSDTTLTTGKACYTEREQLYNEENNSAQCAIGYTKFSVFDCR